MSRTLRRTVCGIAVATLALSGCGVAEDSLRPGLAAEVGETDIPLDRVDDAAANLCDMITYLSGEGAASTVSGAVVRDNSLQYVVLRELGEQLAEEYAVETGELYASSLERNESQLTELGVDPDLVEDMVPLLSSGDYFVDVVQQIGRAELDLTAEEDAGAEGITAGLAIAQEWEATQGLEINPRFSDLGIGDLEGIVVTEGQSISVPVSDFATQAVAGIDPADPDSSYADSLPASQRCG